jgi:hypothetical protein
MNSSTQRGRPDQRLCRIEKRLPTLIFVYLASKKDRRARERTLTENVSPHGVRVISKRSWRPGEETLITPSTWEPPQVGRVIYCSPGAGSRYYLGVEFPDLAVKWVDLSSTQST